MLAIPRFVCVRACVRLCVCPWKMIINQILWTSNNTILEDHELHF